MQATDAFQQERGESVVPPPSKVDLEILYNRLEVFFWLMIVYSLMGFLMSLIGFAEVFSTESFFHRYCRWMTKAVLGVIIVALVVQVVALGVRWYLSGHALWSNGCEAIIFISGVAYFDGNYYLTGLHSYAAGDPIPIPAWIYMSAAGMLLLSWVAYFSSASF